MNIMITGINNRIKSKSIYKFYYSWWNFFYNDKYYKLKLTL